MTNGASKNSEQEFPSHAAEFLEAFFGAGNEVSINDVDLPEKSKLFLEDCYKPLKREDWDWVVLPRKTGEDCTWYGLASSERTARELKENLRSFIGSSYSLFTGVQLKKPAREDPVESAIFRFLEKEKGRVFRLRYRWEERKEVRQCIELMQETLKQRPARQLRIPRSTARILRDFNWTLEQRNEQEAEAILEELESKGRLGAANLAFLKVRRLSGFRKWNELSEYEYLDLLFSLNRPQGTTEALIDWVYFAGPGESGLHVYEESKDAQGLIDRFQGILQEKSEIRHLFKILGSIKSPTSLKAFMAHAVTSSPPDVYLRDKILERYPQDDEGRQFIESLADLIPAPPPEKKKASGKTAGKSLEEKAEAAYGQEHYEQALDLYLDSGISESNAGKILISAEKIGTLGVADQALKAFGGLGRKKQAVVLKSPISKEVHEKLRVLTSIDGQVILNWNQWFERLLASESWPHASRVAELLSSEFKVADLVKKPGEIKKLKGLFSEAADSSAKVDFWNALPTIVKTFTADSFAGFKPICLELMTILGLSNDVGNGEVNAVYDLCEACLPLELNQKEYGELIEALGMTWEDNESPHYLSWVADILELLIQYPAKDEAARDNLLSKFMASLSQFSRWPRGDLWDVFEDLFGDIGRENEIVALRPGIETASEQESLEEQRARILSGKRVGIYTLTPGVAQRFEKVLSNKYPGINVQSNQDKVCTEALTALSKGADYLVVVTRSATHSATGCIDDNRPGDRILRATGKGSASALARLFEAVDKDLEGNGSNQAA